MPNSPYSAVPGQRLPLSEEVRGLLMAQITEGTLKPGQRLPSEPALAKQYGISRPTLREILSGLEADGLVRRVHGVGTFVTQKQPRVETSLDLDIGVTEAVIAAKKTLGVEVLSARRKNAETWITDQLALNPGDQVFSVERIIRVDGHPAAHGLDVIPWHLIERNGSPAYDGASIYRFLERDCGIHLLGGVAEVSATLANTRMAAALDCRRNSPILRLDQIEKSADGHPVLLSQEHYVPGVFNLTVRRVRRGRPGPYDDEPAK
ncbi:GntR family transcriptional regulator [Acrocarpospora corrugata]|uniref:GntR family transcriptional regulator n=1 Tax=Acrocarpospora corrugata TaxID=35763 RepID=UPI0012D31BC6|nr:GntR family transcriptional regulator [Acrocarpospora corrugata]